MSHRQEILDALSDGAKTTDEIVDAVGGERVTVVPELQALRKEGLLAFSPRGGWRLGDAVPVGAEEIDATRTTSKAKRPPKAKRAKPARKKAKKATVVVVPVRAPRDAASVYFFGITEARELTITDRTDVAKTLRLTDDDTARLAQFLARSGPLLEAA